MDYEYRVVDKIGVGPILTTMSEAEEIAETRTGRGLAQVRIERREVGPWAAMPVPAGQDGEGYAPRPGAGDARGGHSGESGVRNVTKG